MRTRRAHVKKTVKKTIRRTRDRFDPRPVAHFMHIGKTAGTALRFTLHDVQKETTYRMVLHGHRARLDGVPQGDKFFFCVRDPIDRFMSGFLARQREDRPRFHIPWTEQEAIAFSHFASPEELALALSAGDPVQRNAEHAMRSIQHVRTSYWDWFGNPSYFKSRTDDLLWVGRQHSLDMHRLAVALGVDELTMPEDATISHRTTNSKPELSDRARQNLKQWYAADYEFVDICDRVFPLSNE
jgi:hypothetical protein